MSETERCGFCFAEYFEMIDPRQMACAHVFCLPCMQEHYENSQGVECAFKHCSEICPHDKVSDLPKYTEEAEEVPVETRSYCDCVGCEGQKAICYCIDCGRSLCKLHNGQHPAFFGNKHKLIGIKIFEEEPEDFLRPICEIHGEPLCRACEDCTKLVCNECDVDKRFCNGIGKQHKLKGFGRFEREVNEEFDKMMKSASERLTEMCKIEKRVWNKHEDVINQYDDLITEVDDRTEKQISVLREEAEKMKEKLREKQKSVTERAVDFTTESVERRTEIELLLSRLSKLKDYAHVTEKIIQREERQREMQTSLQPIKDACSDIKCKETQAMTGQQEIKLNFSIVRPPLKLISTHDMKSQCVTVHHHSTTGDLLIGCADGVKRMSSAGGDVINMTDHTWARAAEYDGEIFISTQIDEIIRILKYKPSESGAAEEHEELFRFPAKSTIASYLSVSAKYIAATDKDNKTIQLYNRATKSVTSRALPGHKNPYNLHFLPDGSLLVTGIGSKLIKCRIPEEEDKQLKIIWTCEGLDFPCGVSSDERGLIYAAGAENKTIYIINEKGKLLHTLTHDKLPSPYEDMSVRGDQLAVAGWNDKNVLLFDLQLED